MLDSRQGRDPIVPPRRPRNHAVWLGPLVTFAGAFSYFAWFARYPLLRDLPWLNLGLVAVGLLVSFAGVWRAFSPAFPHRGKVLGSAGLLLSLLLTLLFNFYVFSLSYRLPAPTATTLSMTEAADFTLMDQRGQPVRLADFRGRKVVLTFYRGFW